ncbi:CPXCG motif-containing cysteine-rich protein [Marinagarivorans cellulosilyticus]|uniref:CPXCG motif-containing cysteine-rich protein n=1 Tax=Marinagarivorans cellulosilyticus TaxID=2721545 RepID=A0AAN2BJ46_9GAMM|nr:CPXCG motif-containing cysteine-rich protein [Marinagarivorans cellulosilyticus]BCD96559.1 hypothetical protein MARGE09_P0759 [Marinagarivorans cellulosilyticus]
MLDTQKCHCPYCGEPIELVIDTSESEQEYIEDCFVCCRPISVKASIDNRGEINVVLQDENS